MAYTLASEKPLVVLDVGERVVSVGFAGESRPRTVLPSEFELDSGVKLRLTLKPGMKRGNLNEWKEALSNFMDNVFFKWLQATPKERRVCVCESFLTPPVFRDALASVLLERLQVMSAVFVLTQWAALLPLAIPSGLVVDVGYSTTRVMPVVYGQPVVDAFTSTPAAGALVNAELDRLLAKCGHKRRRAARKNIPMGPFDDDAGLNEVAAYGPLALDEALLEDIKVRMCRVDISGKPTAPEEDFVYPLSTEEALDVHGIVRTRATWPLFQANNEREIPSVGEAVLESLLVCDPDLRGTAASNIVLIGGTSMLPGFAHGLNTHLNALLADKPGQERYAPLRPMKDKFKFHDTAASFQPNFLGWLGGACYGAILDVVIPQSVSRDQFASNHQLPDWSRLKTEGGDAPRKMGPFFPTPKFGRRRRASSVSAAASYINLPPTSTSAPALAQVSEAAEGVEGAGVGSS